MKPEGTEPHYIIPIKVFEKHRAKIDAITNGDFNPNAMYNIVFLYTDAKDAQRAGTALYGADFNNEYSDMVSRLLGEIWESPKTDEHVNMFAGLNSTLREGLWRNKPAGATNPCASVNPLYAKSKVGKSAYPETVIIKGGQIKNIIFFLVSLIFTVGSFFLIFTGEKFEWYLLFFPALSALFILMLLKPPTTTLSPEGLLITGLAKGRLHKWEEISNLSVRKMGAAGSRIHMLTGDKVIKGKPKNVVLGQVNYKMKNEEFLALLSNYQRDAI